MHCVLHLISYLEHILVNIYFIHYITLHYYKLSVFENRVQRRNSAENAETHAIRYLENITVYQKDIWKFKESFYGKSNAVNACCTMC